MLRNCLNLLMAPMLATALALAIAAPVRADDDDDDGRRVTCPCWTKQQGRRAVDEALRVFSENYFCDSQVDNRRDSEGARGNEEGAEADFFVYDGPYLDAESVRQLDLEATLVLEEGEATLSFCSVEVREELVAFEEDLTRAQALECVRILGGICLENLPTAPARPDDDDDDDDRRRPRRHDRDDD